MDNPPNPFRDTRRNETRSSSSQDASPRSARDRHITTWDEQLGPHNRQTDQRASTSSGSNPVRRLDQEGDNEREQDQPISKQKRLVDNIQQIKNDIQQKKREIPHIEEDIQQTKGEWEKHKNGEKVLSGLELLQFGDKVTTAMKELRTISSTMQDLDRKLNEYQTEINSEWRYLSPSAKDYRAKVDSEMKDRKEILDMADRFVVSHLPDLLDISSQVKSRQRQRLNKVMEDSRPWMELDKSFTMTVDSNLGEMRNISERGRENARKQTAEEYEKFKNGKLQGLENEDKIRLGCDLLKSHDKMNKEGKPMKEIEEELDNLNRNYLERGKKGYRDIGHLVEKKEDEVRKEIEEYIKDKVPELIKTSRFIKSMRSK